jgi:hypothetical protein
MDSSCDFTSIHVVNFVIILCLILLIDFEKRAKKFLPIKRCLGVTDAAMFIPPLIFLKKSYMYGVQNEDYLQNIFTDECNFA